MNLKIIKGAVIAAVMTLSLCSAVSAGQTNEKSVIKVVNGEAVKDSDGTPKIFKVSDIGGDGPVIKMAAENTDLKIKNGAEFRVDMTLRNTSSGFIVFNFERAEESYDTSGRSTGSIAELSNVEYGNIGDFNITNMTGSTKLIPDGTSEELKSIKNAFIEYDGDEIVRANGESTILTFVYRKTGNGFFKPAVRELNGCLFVSPEYENEPVVYIEIDSIKLGDEVNESSSSSETEKAPAPAPKPETSAAPIPDETSETVTEKSTEETTNADYVVIKASEKTKESFFDDISSRPWAEEAINNLAKNGIVNGVGDRKFAPDSSSKRADFIIIAAKILGLEGTAKNNFSDVAQEKYYANYVGLAKESGIAAGYSDNTFAPENTITRQDMMVLVGKMLEYNGIEVNGDVSVLEQFDDYNDMSEYAKPYAAYLVENGIVTGTGNNIEGKKLMTRAQMCVLMNNVMKEIK